MQEGVGDEPVPQIEIGQGGGAVLGLADPLIRLAYCTGPPPSGQHALYLRERLLVRAPELCRARLLDT